MPNNILPAQRWVALLDEIYQEAATSNILDTDSRLLQWLAGSLEFKLGMLTMDGLGDYSRTEGYPKGNVTLDWQTHKPDWERGRMFTVDTMDDEESASLVFSNLAGEFIRTKVVPELDAVRYAKYAGLTPAGNIVSGDLDDGAALISALREATNTLNNKEVPRDGRILCITSDLMGVVEDLDTTKSKAVLNRFSAVQEVPPARFYSAVNLKDGISSGETGGGYEPAAGAKSINFQVIHKPATLQALKHVAPKIITPDANQDADAWKYGYRTYGITSAQKLKLNGLYLHLAV